MSMADRKHIPRPAKHYAIALSVALVTGLGTWIGWMRSDASATPPVAAPPSPAAPASAAPPTAPASPAPAATNATGDPATTQIVFTTSPAVHATVTWGSTRLGRITPREPLVVVRPRDSGPLDVIVRAAGFMSVQTRAHTFADTKVHVKLTRPEDKATLIGYRMPIDAGVPLDPDGGIPPAISGMPPSLADPPFSPILPPAVAPSPVTPPAAAPPAVTPATPPATTNTVPPALAR
jgi:hypothetical protein